MVWLSGPVRGSSHSICAGRQRLIQDGFDVRGFGDLHDVGAAALFRGFDGEAAPFVDLLPPPTAAPPTPPAAVAEFDDAAVAIDPLDAGGV